MSRLLIVYASRFGQTGKIAKRIAAASGVETDVLPVEYSDTISLQNYDFLIVASSVYFGKHNPKIEEFVRRNAVLIAAMQSAFVSVSGSADVALVRTFEKRTGWVPEIQATFRGAELWTKYGFFTRLLMRTIAGSQGRKVDTHRDCEYTDWSAVDRFARDFIGYASSKQKSA